MRVLVLAALLLVACAPTTVRPTGSAIPAVRASADPSADLGGIFDRTPEYPGHHWTQAGRDVTPEELGTIAGPVHCGWQRATILSIGWPAGTHSSSSAQARQYIRDPFQVMPSGNLRGPLVLHAKLLGYAHLLGYRFGSV